MFKVKLNANAHRAAIKFDSMLLFHQSFRSFISSIQNIQNELYKRLNYPLQDA